MCGRAATHCPPTEASESPCGEQATGTKRAPAHACATGTPRGHLLLRRAYDQRRVAHRTTGVHHGAAALAAEQNHSTRVTVYVRNSPAVPGEARHRPASREIRSQESPTAPETDSRLHGLLLVQCREQHARERHHLPNGRRGECREPRRQPLVSKRLAVVPIVAARNGRRGGAHRRGGG